MAHHDFYIFKIWLIQT